MVAHLRLSSKLTGESAVGGDSSGTARAQRYLAWGANRRELIELVIDSVGA